MEKLSLQDFQPSLYSFLLPADPVVSFSGTDWLSLCRWWQASSDAPNRRGIAGEVRQSACWQVIRRFSTVCALEASVCFLGAHLWRRAVSVPVCLLAEETADA